VPAVCSVCGNIHSVYFITGDTVLRSRALFDVSDGISAMCRHRTVRHNVRRPIMHQGRFHLPVFWTHWFSISSKAENFLIVCLSVAFQERLSLV